MHGLCFSATHRTNTASTYTQLKATRTAIAELQVQIEENEQQIKAASAEVSPARYTVLKLNGHVGHTIGCIGEHS